MKSDSDKSADQTINRHVDWNWDERQQKIEWEEFKIYVKEAIGIVIDFSVAAYEWLKCRYQKIRHPKAFWGYRVVETDDHVVWAKHKKTGRNLTFCKMNRHRR